jgi:hypothetical protein
VFFFYLKWFVIMAAVCVAIGLIAPIVTPIALIAFIVYPFLPRKHP